MTSEGPLEAQHPLLVTTTWLADQIDDPDCLLIDCGEPVAYRRAHIPGAVSISHQPYLKGERDARLVMNAEQFQRHARSLGVSNDTPVVLYDDNASLHAARVWWVFDLYGHKNVRVVDGGFNAWLDEGWPLTSKAETPEPGDFSPRVDESHLCTLDDLKADVEGGSPPQLWDTRSDGEWSGEHDRGNARAGHVDGAVHLEWLRLMEGPPARRFLPLDEIRQTLVDAGINPEAETVTY